MGLIDHAHATDAKPLTENVAIHLDGAVIVAAIVEPLSAVKSDATTNSMPLGTGQLAGAFHFACCIDSVERENGS